VCRCPGTVYKLHRILCGFYRLIPERRFFVLVFWEYAHVWLAFVSLGRPVTMQSYFFLCAEVCTLNEPVLPLRLKVKTKLFSLDLNLLVVNLEKDLCIFDVERGLHL